MKLIAGLGNPGTQYVNSRHNVGFEILGKLARRTGQSRPRAKFEGEIIETQLGNEKVVLLCPLTYMNLSGRSVKAALSFYQIPLEQVLIVCDDFNLDLGRIRIRIGGSAGGQNGLSDVIEKMGNNQVPRLRFGIGKPPPRWEVKNFVLSKFENDEKEIADLALERAADAVECWVRDGIQVAMNRFNSEVEEKVKKKQVTRKTDAKQPADDIKLEDGLVGKSKTEPEPETEPDLLKKNSRHTTVDRDSEDDKNSEHEN